MDSSSSVDNHIAAALERECNIKAEPGNAVTLLHNGPNTFPAMLDAIAAARESITFENYRIWSDKIGWEFAEALAARAREGIAVNVVYDGYGSESSDPEFWATIEDAGGTVRPFHPLFDRSTKSTVRDHRKLMVVDGRVGFIGGHCITDDWSRHDAELAPWRDMHCRIEGPAVAELQAIFSESWNEAGGTPLDRDDPRYFPELPHAGNIAATMIASSNERAITRAYRTVLDHARERVLITNGYFLPTAEIKRALKGAAARGVKVQLLTTCHADIGAVVLAARTLYDELIEAGLEIYEYQPTLLHAKAAIVDGCWATIGSCNLDRWSLETNYEANIAISDLEFARALEHTFEDDLSHSRRITLEEWRNRPLIDKLKERAVATFSNEL